MKRWIGMSSLALLLAIFVLPWGALGQQQHGITVSWTETNNSDSAVGFNVYRATVAGGPYTKVNSTLLASSTLSYFDPTVTGGTKYFYVIASVDSFGVQSVNSNEISATAVAGAPNPPVATGAVAQ